jgi:hypothetical protein
VLSAIGLAPDSTISVRKAVFASFSGMSSPSVDSPGSI